MAVVSSPVVSSREDLALVVEQLLACPRCQHSVRVQSGDVKCGDSGCDFVGRIQNGVVLVQEQARASFFDDRHEGMQQVTADSGIRCLCYDRQVRVLEGLLKPGRLVLDVGCGPSLPYETAGSFVIGLDSSYGAIRANEDVDLRVYGTVLQLPLPDASVDVVVCLYSVHHMVGGNLAETRQNVHRAFSEFARVLKPDGDLLVFEVNPWEPFGTLQSWVWNLARRFLGPKLDMYFWSKDSLTATGAARLPGASFEMLPFKSSWTATFPPIFACPRLRVPRVLYPFGVNLYHWHVDSRK